MTLKRIPAPSSGLLFFPASDREYVHFQDASRHPFDHTARGLSRVNAWWLADAALLAYWDEAAARGIWSRAGLRFQMVSNQGVQCHIGSTDAFVIVAFRGTEPDELQDLLDIARVAPIDWKCGGKVHSGFIDAHERIWPAVARALDDLDVTHRSVWFAGHSLGAALATLSMDCFGGAKGLYTIGSPPVGDRRFAALFNGRHAGRCFRYVNHLDIVVHAPTWLPWLRARYAHIDERRYIDAKGAISSASPSLSDWWLLLRTPKAVPQANDSPGATELPDALIDHTPRRYAVHIWNDYARSPSAAVAATGRSGATTPA